MRGNSACWQWAREQFGEVELGDARRRSRLLAIAARVAQRPSGKVASVFGCAAEQQASYDFLESESVAAESLEAGLGRSCASMSCEYPFVFVAVDGSTLSIADKHGLKGLGSVGGSVTEGRGIKVVTAIASDPSGCAIGVAAQSWWIRPPRPKRSRREQKRDDRRRAVAEKETRHWLNVIDRTAERFDAVGAEAWFVIDREADSCEMLSALAATGHRFTIRASWDRRIDSDDVQGDWSRKPKHGPVGQRLRAVMARQQPLAIEPFRVPGTPKRTARIAQLQITARPVVVRMPVRDTRVVAGDR